MAKKSIIKSRKSYKSLLSKLYMMVIIIFTATGAGYYILQVNNTLQSIYQSDTKTNNTNQTNLQNVSQSTTDSINKLHESQQSTVPVLPTADRVNPFN